MPAALLHRDATVKCAHTGSATPSAPDVRVTVSGKPVVPVSSPYTVAGCTLPSNAGGPCVSAQYVSSATRVFVSGTPVLLVDSQAVCSPTGTPLSVMASQTRVTGV